MARKLSGVKSWLSLNVILSCLAFLLSMTGSQEEVLSCGFTFDLPFRKMPLVLWGRGSEMGGSRGELLPPCSEAGQNCDRGNGDAGVDLRDSEIPT